MRHDGMLAQKTEIAQRVRVGLAETLEHHVVLPLALVAVRLNVHVVRGGEIAQAFKHLVGAAGNETRRHDGPDALTTSAADGFQLADQRGRIGDRLRRRGIAIVIGVGLGIVHDGLAHQRALTRLLADLRQGDAGLEVGAAQVNDRGPSMTVLPTSAR